MLVAVGLRCRLRGWGWGRWCGVRKASLPGLLGLRNGPRRFVAGVQMRCRECVAEVAVAARVCSRCGAPIVGQPRVVADAVVADTVVADTVLAAISDAAREAVPAGVAGQALPEPYVPGSGGRVPAELRLVLGGYVGIAGALFAAALACAAAAVLFFFGDPNDLDGDRIAQLSALFVCICALWPALPALGALGAGTRFSRLLRGPSDPHTSTVMGSKRGGRTLILDIPWDGTGPGYQPLSEVHLALWMKGGMLVPGERVTVYGGPSGENPLLISSAQRGRAFLGTMKGRSTVQPGPVPPLDEKVSGATLVEWAAWAASTTFSYTGLKSGYDTREVDAFGSAVRDTFLGVSAASLRSDDVRGKQFSTHRLREGYDKKQVDAFLDAAAIRLAAMESMDRPAGPLVSADSLAAWAEWADSATFPKPRIGHGKGHTPEKVDAFREEIRDTFLGATKSPVKSRRRLGQRSRNPEWREIPQGVRGAQFSSPEEGRGYDEKQVHAFLDAAGIRLAAMESTDRPTRPLVSGAILAGWAAWADSTRFSTRRRRDGYDRAEVDAFRKEIRDTFLGVRRPSLTWPAVPGKRFTTTRPGYDVEEVDAFFDRAEPRLAAMRRSDKQGT
jgi:DivIVA domain-containing protein